MNFDTGKSRLFNCRRKYSANPCAQTPERQTLYPHLIAAQPADRAPEQRKRRNQQSPVAPYNPIAEPCSATGTMFAK
ncbi:MAG TPA: hypothetical protein VFE95_00970 [Pseudomonas sp.]|jgi:hypothetical protein|nr:hypothetical protein [Pseudomonas sp.]